MATPHMYDYHNCMAITFNKKGYGDKKNNKR